MYYQVICYKCYHSLATQARVVWVGFSAEFTCLSVFSKRCLKKLIDEARITKLDIELSHNKSWEPIYFEDQKVKGQGHDKQKHCWRGSLHSYTTAKKSITASAQQMQLTALLCRLGGVTLTFLPWKIHPCDAAFDRLTEFLHSKTEQ